MAREIPGRWQLASTSERSDWRRRGLGIDVLDGEWCCKWNSKILVLQESNDLQQMV